MEVSCCPVHKKQKQYGTMYCIVQSFAYIFAMYE